jgi:hypothetical protein
LAYWFSAPTATITFALSAVVAGCWPDEQAVASSAAAAMSTATATRWPAGMTEDPFMVVTAWRGGRAITNENDNQYG